MTLADTLTAFDTLVRWSLTAVVLISAFVLGWVAMRWLVRKIKAGDMRAKERARERTRRIMGEGSSSGYPWGQPSQTDDCGDSGGHPVEHRQSRPKAPETGSGRPVQREWD